MSEFCYIIEDRDGSRWLLDDEGPDWEAADFARRLDRNGFRHTEDRPIGSCVLHVFERAMPATDIVTPDPSAHGR
jgi:hypothetical protein